jgi:DNA-binding Lrp family transcriptional regulator
LEAYVLVQTETKGREPVADELRAIPDIVWAEDLRGPYDAIARVRADSRQDLLRRVLEEVRKVPGVTRALPAPLARPVVEAPAANEAA